MSSRSYKPTSAAPTPTSSLMSIHIFRRIRVRGTTCSETRVKLTYFGGEFRVPKGSRVPMKMKKPPTFLAPRISNIPGWFQ